MKRAGDVVGTPDWQLDLMYETESAQMWAEQNSEFKPLSERFKPLKGVSRDAVLHAHSNLYVVDCGELNHLFYMEQALKLIAGTQEGQKLASLYDRLCDLQYDIHELSTKLEKEFHAR